MKISFTSLVAGLLAMFLAAFALSILLAFPVKWLWNSTTPELFAFHPIGVWMAWKLSFLTSILFKSNGSTSTTSTSK